MNSINNSLTREKGEEMACRIDAKSSRQKEMEAFSELPPLIQAALQNAWFSFSAYKINESFKRMRGRITPEVYVKAIEAEQTRMIAAEKKWT